MIAVEICILNVLPAQAGYRRERVAELQVQQREQWPAQHP